jgi:hypothetical protein
LGGGLNHRGHREHREGYGYRETPRWGSGRWVPGWSQGVARGLGLGCPFGAGVREVRFTALLRAPLRGVA